MLYHYKLLKYKYYNFFMYDKISLLLIGNNDNVLIKLFLGYSFCGLLKHYDLSLQLKMWHRKKYQNSSISGGL